MNIVARLTSIFKDYYKGINTATLTGAIDVIVVRQDDGTFRSSPFHVRFGKLGVFKSKQKIVDIEINGVPVDLHMKLGEAGEAFFIEKVSNDDNDDDDDDDTINDLDDEILKPTPLNTDLTVQKTCNEEAKEINHEHETQLNKEAQSSIINPMSYQNDENLINQPNSIEIGDIIISNSSDMKTDLCDKIDQNENTKSKTKQIPNCFSDGDLTPEITSPVVSRPSTPKSDTEIEINRKKPEINENNMNSDWNWPWGKLPEREQNTDEINATNNISECINSTEIKVTNEIKENTKVTLKKKTDELVKEEKKGLFTEMITSLIHTNRKQNEFEGVYLGDTDKLDSEVAALYINQKNSYRPIVVQKDEDQESGRGHSVPQSPTSKEDSLLGDVQISLCGINDQMNANYDEIFQQHSITYERFIDELCTIINNQNLVFKIHNRYMDWACAAPIILSAIVFHKPLPNEVVSQMIDININKNIQQKSQQQKTQQLEIPSLSPPPQQQQQQQQQNSKSWKFWGKKSTTVTLSTSTSTTTTTTNTTNITTSNITETNTKLTAQKLLSNDDADNNENTIVDDSTTTPPNNTENKMQLEVSNSHIEIKTIKQNVKREQYRKTTRLSNELISKLNLRPGANEISYSVTTAYQGTTRINSYIFLWDYDDKIIVSDIDGTITKSDVWGQVLPMFGRDWTQTGVADLFTAIENNSYKFMYLSARAIGQSKLTRDLLRNINQDGLTLPEGPLLVTPTSLFTAFHKEVIEKKPQEFKISCLEDIKSLFPKDRNPFYAGYGNRTNDVISYKTVGIPMSRIFTINPRGELKHEVSQTFQSSYSKLCDYVDQIFPPLKSSLLSQSEYSSFNFWKNPLPLMQLDNEENLNDTNVSIKSTNILNPRPINATKSASSSTSNLRNEILNEKPHESEIKIEPISKSY